MNRHPQLSSRAALAQVLTHVVKDGVSLDRELEEGRAHLRDARDQAFLQECAYGTLRHWYELRQRLMSLMPRPLRKRDSVVEALLLGGLYQLFVLGTAEHAVVDQSAAACGSLERGWAAGLVNATLRNAIRRRQEFQSPGDPGDEVRWNHPQWLVDAVRQAWPADWQAVLTANGQRPPFTLRVNRRRIQREDYLAMLLQADIRAEALPFCANGLIVQDAVPVAQLPGFAEGLVSVQDGAAQLAATLLDVHPGHRILDACAAPGGKALQLLEAMNDDVSLMALDIDATRLQRIAVSAARLGLACSLLAGDAATPAHWWDGIAYDRILLDAPCSATGVIRRHPDIKFHRRPDELHALAAAQSRILDGLWPLLRDGGKLLYATCSVLPEENDGVISAALSRHRQFVVKPLHVEWGRPTLHGRQILCGEHNMDGFYYCLIEKLADA